ncbi:hypothetical protein PV325_013671, partial [Microctonus aethiopoides]
SGRDKFIELMNDGGLIYLSENVFLLIRSLEEDVLTVVGTKTIKCNTMHQILDKISLRQSLPKLGCLEHTKELMIDRLDGFSGPIDQNLEKIKGTRFILKNFENSKTRNNRNSLQDRCETCFCREKLRMDTGGGEEGQQMQSYGCGR